VHEARRPEAVDIGDHVRVEAVDERRRFGVVLRSHPRAAPFQVYADGTVGVPTHEPHRRLDRSHDRDRLLRQRAPREVAAKDDQVDVLARNVAQDSLERRSVPVDVRERGDAH
jgi:hypothetical protein